MKGSRRRRGLRRLHYLIGLFILGPLLILSVTGVLLNHGSEWGLDQQYLTAKTAGLFYDVAPRPPAQGFHFQQGDTSFWISRARDQLFFGDAPVGEFAGEPIGVAPALDFVAVASSVELKLFTREGRLVDRLPLPESFVPLAALSSNGELIIDTVRGRRYSQPPWLQWNEKPSRAADKAIHTLEKKALPEALQQQIIQRLAGKTVTWQRFMLDLHSGRILGPVGPWALDLVALTTILLAITGCILWVRMPTARSRKRRF